jgi:hypothetical protein
VTLPAATRVVVRGCALAGNTLSVASITIPAGSEVGTVARGLGF